MVFKKSGLGLSLKKAVLVLVWPILVLVLKKISGLGLVT